MVKHGRFTGIFRAPHFEGVRPLNFSRTPPPPNAWPLKSPSCCNDKVAKKKVGGSKKIFYPSNIGLHKKKQFLGKILPLEWTILNTLIIILISLGSLCVYHLDHLDLCIDRCPDHCLDYWPWPLSWPLSWPLLASFGLLLLPPSCWLSQEVHQLSSVALFEVS